MEEIFFWWQLPEYNVHLIKQYKNFMSIYSELEKRILVIDGAMGTMIQRYHLQENDFRGETVSLIFLMILKVIMTCCR